MSVTLSLRVSGDKRKPPTKQSNGKEENISYIIKRLRKIHCNGLTSYLDELQLCSSVDKQLTILKEITNRFIKSSDEAVDEEVLEFCVLILVEIYLSVSLKSPLKSGITRILNGLSEMDQKAVHKQLCKSIQERLSQERIGINTYNEYSNILIACFESFVLGCSSVIACIEVVGKFIHNAIKLCTELLSKEMSPTEKLEVCRCVHSVIRISVCIVQKSCFPCLKVLRSNALNLVSMEDLPLDTRTNCGLLAVLCSKQDWIQLLTEFCPLSSDVTKLCIYSGILNAVTYIQLEQTIALEANDSSGPAIHILFNSLMEIQNRNPTDCIIVLSISRIMLLLSRTLHQNPTAVIPLLPSLLDYTWTHLDHYMDSVRHLVTSLLESLVKLNGPGVDVLTHIQDKMQETPMWSRAKHAAISVLIGHKSVEGILRSSPDLIPKLLEYLQHPVVASHIVNSYESLMQRHLVEETEPEKWTKVWVQPLILALDKCSNVALQQVLAKAVMACPHIVKQIMYLENINISTILSCLLVSRKLGLLDNHEKEDCKWKGLITYQSLSEAFLHTNDKVRLSCLALLVESHKSTEVFTIAELQLIKQYLTYNLSFQKAASKQESQALITKFLVRLKDSAQMLQKDIIQAEKKEAAGYLKEVMEEYSIFCEWLVELCIDNLFPGANYNRRNTVLQILTSCHKLELWPDNKKTHQEGDILLECLSDSYEDNKTLAMQLLEDIPSLVPAFQDPQQLVCILKKCISLGGSIRPPETITAAYLLSTLSAFCFSQETYELICEESEEFSVLLNNDIVKKEVYCCLMVILKNLSEQLKVAESSLLRAASTGPLYGLLFMVRHLLERISLKELESSCSWQHMIKRIITISFSCSQTVASIVNSSSPEGHLPMDFDFDTSKLQTDKDDSIDPIEVSSQMVLLCSWRTVKEVSLLLGYIAEQAPVSSDGQVKLLDKEDVLKIGDHLTTMLAETKHRGAFEQAYVGFCKLASRLWRFPSGDLHSLPNKWLQETMQEISNGGKLCATRRSAGVPFMIQALICTELEVKGRSTLSIWMNQLLVMAENESLSPETHTHALNIMRALFRNTQLGETVSPFVERAIMITVNGFSAPTWPERNSATLLLSTLFSRVFGVPRSKSHILSWKNKMTGRIFFQRYPKLFDFFHDHLETATKSSNKGSLHPSLYPVLLFLGRLYPSSLEGTDSNLQLNKYIPYIQACAGSTVLKTRTLAAAAMVPLISPDKLPHCLDNLFSHLTQSNLNTNVNHGNLLQACFLLEYITELPEGALNEMEKHCEDWIHALIILLGNKQCPVVTENLFRVILLLTKFSKPVPLNKWINLSEKLNNFLFSSKQNYIGRSLCLKKCAELLLKVNVLFLAPENLIGIITQLLSHEEYEVVYTVLDYLSVLLSPSPKQQPENEESSSMKLVKLGVLKNKSVAELILNKIFINSTHSSDIEKVLSVVKVYPLLLRSISEKLGVQMFVEICKDEIRVVDGLQCIQAFLSEKISCSENDINAINNLLLKYSKPEHSEDCHQTIALLLLHHFHMLSNSELPLDSRLMVYTTLVQLQYDAPSIWQKLLKEFTNIEDNLHCKAVVLLALALGDLSNDSSVQTLSKSQVFDKGEVSCCYEEAMLSQQAGIYFKKLLNSVNDQFILTPLLPSLTQFLYLHCGIEAETLASFLSSVKKLGGKQFDDGVCCFLKSGYWTAKLKSIKIKNVL